MGGGFDMGAYNDVPARMHEFFEKYPEGSLRCVESFRLETVGSNTYLAYVAAAYRHPEDPAPGIGSAWEPVPGLTPYTKNSELQNAETSAWGRAIMAVGAADAKRDGVASKEEVRNRRAERDDHGGALPAQSKVCGSCRKAITGPYMIDGGGYRHKACPPVAA